MTNQLFRDYLDGKIPGPEHDPYPSLPQRFLLGVELLPWQVEYLKRILPGVNQALDNFAMAIRGALPIRPRAGYAIDWITKDDTKPDPPTDPRARALWAKENRRHGPTIDDLGRRGRVTRYRTKG